MPQSRLYTSLEELQELFGIELLSYEPVAFPTGRDRRRWTIEDSEWLELLYVNGISVALIVLILGHSKETVLQWASASQLRRPPREGGEETRPHNRRVRRGTIPGRGEDTARRFAKARAYREERRAPDFHRSIEDLSQLAPITENPCQRGS